MPDDPQLQFPNFDGKPPSGMSKNVETLRVWTAANGQFCRARKTELGVCLAVALMACIWLWPAAHAQNAAPPPASKTESAPAAAQAPDAAPTPPVAPASTPVPKAPAAPNSSQPAAPPAQTTTPAKSAGSKISWSSVEVDGPYIAMTFDDGPHATNTPKLLDLLAKKHIRATFFLVGECAQQYPEIVKREVAEGHEVANHSWSHPNLMKMSDDAVRGQIKRTEDAIVAACGVKPVLMRPPYGNLTTRQRQTVHDEFGYKIILWDIDPLDWKYRNAAHVAHEIIAHTQNGSIILSHDIHATTIDAMPEVFDALLGKGFKFVTVSELVGMYKPKPKPETAPPAPDPGGDKPSTSSGKKRKSGK
jgi:peptidoglycan-N-acetylglucosamine deacetylase